MADGRGGGARVLSRQLGGHPCAPVAALRRGAGPGACPRSFGVPPKLASGGRALSSRPNHSAAQARASSRSHVVEAGVGAFVFRPERAPSSAATDGRYVARDAEAALRTQAAADDDDAILSRFRSVSGSAVLDEILRERAAAIADIHASTLLLNEIARDLAGEVAAQQDHVDALEDNNARANAAITQGHAKLKEAQEHQHAGCVVC